jgi:hypothetical protein
LKNITYSAVAEENLVRNTALKYGSAHTVIVITSMESMATAAAERLGDILGVVDKKAIAGQ